VPRCPDCNTFARVDQQDFRIDNLEVDTEGVVTATARIVNSYAECGTELREATFELGEDCSEILAEHLNSRPGLVRA
jgi:hypothetical protein